MRGLNADHSEELHVNPVKVLVTLPAWCWYVGLSPRYWLCPLLAPAGRLLQFLLFVAATLFVLVSSLQALTAVGRAGQALQVRAVALRALPLRQDPADDALAGAGDDHVSHVQQLRGQDTIVQLELPTKPRGEKVGLR